MIGYGLSQFLTTSENLDGNSVFVASASNVGGVIVKAVMARGYSSASPNPFLSMCNIDIVGDMQIPIGTISQYAPTLLFVEPILIQTGNDCEVIWDFTYPNEFADRVDVQVFYEVLP